jgi:hypothetical protein
MGRLLELYELEIRRRDGRAGAKSPEPLDGDAAVLRDSSRATISDSAGATIVGSARSRRAWTYRGVDGGIDRAIPAGERLEATD